MSFQAAFAQVNPLAQKIDLTLQDADLLAALNALTVQTGIQFAIEPTDKEFKKVTLSLRGMTAEQAIEYVCKSAGAHAVRDENGVFVIKFGLTGEIKAGAGAGTGTGPVVPVLAPHIVRSIKLMHGDARDIYVGLTTGNYDTNNMNEEMASFIRNVKIAPGYNNHGADVRDISNPSYYANPVNSKPQVEPNTQGGSNDNGISLPGELAGQRGGAGGGGGGQGGPGGGPGGGSGGPGGGGNGLGLTGGQGLVPAGIDNIIYDPGTNSFIVQGTDEAIRQLESIIDQFDKAPEQVLVDVKFVTSSNGLDKSLGIDWAYQRGSIFTGNRSGTFARTNDPVFINYATGNLQLRLRTLLTEGYGRVVNNPSVRTLNNQTANVSFTTQTTIFINQVTATNGGVIITSNPVSLPSVTQLTVRPRINGDRTITMGLAPTISEFGQLRRSPDGQEVPDILQQSISVVVRVKDGETIAMGGLTRKTDNFSRSKIPVLGDLPIIGQLFQGRNSTQSSQELTIFVTPKIIDETFTGVNP
jgi:general secretion pathway protein D